MPKAILGTKLGMTQIFSPEGKIIPVTVVQAGPCRIAQVKTEENDGYTAIQLGYGALKPVQVNKPLQGHCEKAGIEPVKFFREVRTKDVSGYQPGDTVSVDIFAAGELVDVSGVSKGKGFAGTIKRWNNRRGPMTHAPRTIAVRLPLARRARPAYSRASILPARWARKMSPFRTWKWSEWMRNAT